SRCVRDGGRDDSELVASEARHGVARAQCAPQSPPDLPQQEVSARMAQCVVDLLEAIEVEQHDGETTSLALRLQQRLPRTIREERAVGQTSQPVMQRLVFDPLELFLESLLGATKGFLASLSLGDVDHVALRVERPGVAV